MDERGGGGGVRRCRSGWAGWLLNPGPSRCCGWVGSQFRVCRSVDWGRRSMMAGAEASRDRSGRDQILSHEILSKLDRDQIEVD